MHTLICEGIESIGVVPAKYRPKVKLELFSKL